MIGYWIGPVRGFGWLWCNNAEVRNQLGRPEGPEAGSGDVEPFVHGMYFEGGAIFFKPRLQDHLNTTEVGIAFFNDGGWRLIDLP